jgi:hypothetical protein
MKTVKKSRIFQLKRRGWGPLQGSWGLVSMTVYLSERQQAGLPSPGNKTRLSQGRKGLSID